MENFPSVYQSKGGKQITNARLLYAFLELADGQFTRWAKTHIIENKYAAEGVDYQQVDVYVELHNGGSRSVEDYALTLSFAKKLAMVSDSPKGEQVRDYFLACEERARQSLAPSYQIDDPIVRAERWIAEQREKQMLQLQVESLKPKAVYADAVLSSTTEITTTTIAAELGLSAVSLNKKLHALRIQRKLRGTWILYSVHADKGYAHLRTHPYTDSQGNPKSKHYLVWTETGRQFIHSKLSGRLSSPKAVVYAGHHSGIA